jgi:hypothetical protein
MVGFTVPIATNLFGNIDPEIAKGVPVPDINNLVQSYKAGSDLIQQYQLQNLFRGGLPRDPITGDFDYKQIADQLARATGAGAIPQLAALRAGDIQQETGRAIDRLAPKVFSPVEQQPQTQQPAPVSLNRTPGAPAASYAATEDQSGGGERRLRPDQLGNLGEVTGVQYGPVTGPNTATPFAGEPQPGPGYPEQFRQTTQPGPPTGSFQVAQAQPQRQPAQAQTPQAQPPPPDRPLVPEGAPGFFTLENAKAYEDRAAQVEWAATRIGADKDFAEASKRLGDRAQQLSGVAKQIREQIGKREELTPTMKEGLAAGLSNPMEYEGRKTAQDLQIKAGDAAYKGIQAASSQYGRDLKPYLDLSRSILSDPRMYSGIGGEASLNWNRVKAVMGDRTGAMLQEGLQKVTAQTVLGLINTQRDQLMEAGGNSGRIFSSQVDLVQKAAPTLSTTLGGNRFLVEVASRIGELQNKVADMARNYKTTHPLGLDAGFDQRVADYLKGNPIFSNQERSDPAILGAPTVPSTIAGNRASIQQWGNALGLQQGNAIRFPDGQVRGFTLQPPQ